jgi:parallel beta-helix repeat protein
MTRDRGCCNRPTEVRDMTSTNSNREKRIMGGSPWLSIAAIFALLLAMAPAALANHNGPITFVDIKNPAEDDQNCDFHFKTLKAALTRCPLQEYGTIIVDPGIYAEGVLPVGVKGLIVKSSSGAQRTKINGCFQLNAKEVQLQGFDINAASCDQGIVVANREIQVRDNIVHEAKIDGIEVMGASDAVTLANNRLFNNSRYGLSVRQDSSHSLQITRNEIQSNGSSGIFLEGNTDRFNISDNDIALNLGAGILILGSDEGQVTNNKLQANQLEGIKLDKSNDNVIVNNTLTANGLFGISIVGGNNNEVRNNQLLSNRAGGVALRGNGASAQRNTIESNKIENNTQSGASGVLLEGNVTGSIVLKNEIRRNSFGVRFTRSPVASESEPSNNTIDSNQIMSSDEDGVRIEASFGLNLFRSNQITDNNRVGVRILGGRGNDDLLDNMIQRNGDEGIRIEGSERNTIRENDIALNGGGDGSGGVNDGGGIVLLRAHYTTVSRNSLRDGEANGILLRETNNAKILQNTLERYQQDGVNGVNLQNLLIEDNRIQTNRERGISLRDCTAVDLQRNTITGNTLGGIFFANCRSVNLQMSDITENLRYGLWVENSQTVSARRNWWGDPKGPAGVFEGRGNAVIMIGVQGGNSFPLEIDQIVDNLLPWLTDRVDEQMESSVSGFLLRDFGPGKVDLDRMDRADVRVSLLSVEKEERGIAILAKYGKSLPSENSYYRPSALTGALKTVNVLTSGFGTGTAIVTVGFSDAELGSNVNRANLRLFYWSGSRWVLLPGKSLQNVNLVEGEIDVRLLRDGVIITLAPQQT